MNNVCEQFEQFAASATGICSHVSVRQDENGPYVFALGRKDTHTLQMRMIQESYVLELWHGKTADVEWIVDTLTFTDMDAAFSQAKEWLLKDAI